LKTNTRRTKVFRRCMVTVFALAGASAVLAEENCNAWHPPDNDPTHGQFMLELRSCDLAMGVSAYIQIRNNGEDRVALTYRLIMKDDKQKDSDITLEPYSSTRAGNCQACAKRYAGLKSWDILSAKSLGKAPPPEKAAPDAAATAPTSAAPEAGATSSNVSSNVPAKSTPVVSPAAPASTTATNAAPAVSAASTAPKTAAPEAPKAEAKKEETKKEKLTEKDGFKAEDGTIIPWDQLPPEFRPRNKSEGKN